jgi:RHS repeat-associated protein
MEKKSGVQETAHGLPTGGGAVRTIGSSFQPNLAMGGGSLKLPVDLPIGPGGFSPNLELSYNTGVGNGPQGLGWRLSIPYIERRHASPFEVQDEITYTLAGAERLVPIGESKFVPFISQGLQTFHFDGEHWQSTLPNLTSMRFGAAEESRIAGEVDGQERVQRWLVDRVSYPGDRHIDYHYRGEGSQRYLERVRWAMFRLEFEYEERPDPFSTYEAGFELRTGLRLARIILHNDRLEPHTQMRTFRFEYRSAPHTGTSLLRSVQISGWRFLKDRLQETALPPLTFGYTEFDPQAGRIAKFTTNTVPPPPLADDVTLIDYRSTGLPGVLRMNGIEATYWENRGNLTWGPPQKLPALPQSVHLSENRIRFADLTGNGAVDLVLADSTGGGYFPNDPEKGFMAKRSLPLAPSFSLDDPGSYLLDLDGDGVIDFLMFRNNAPLAFFNERGERWAGPVALPSEHLPSFAFSEQRLRFADMNGDGLPDLVLLQSRQIVYWPGLGRGRWGPPRIIEDTPAFNVPHPEQDVYLVDVDGNGAADLVLVGSGVIDIYLNAGGERFDQPIRLKRTPRPGNGQLLFADVTGSGVKGLLWTSEGSSSSAHGYWFLDLLAGVKPYLLNHIDNGCGGITAIDYSSSTAERVADLNAGHRWHGYLPFAVQVVKRVTITDAVLGRSLVTSYRYHDGNYDGRAREYIGFGSVESRREATDQEATVLHRIFFHNRGATADDPAFIAGKGQPHRTEIIDPATNEVCQVDESQWAAQPAPGTSSDRAAYLALEKERRSRRLQDGAPFEQERIAFAHDPIGNVIREHRRGEWVTSDGTPQVDERVIEHSYAVHPVHGLTNIPAGVKEVDGQNRLQKHIRYYYDGPAFIGLPWGQVENGFRTRQTEGILTEAAVETIYGTVPQLFREFYRLEDDPEHGRIYVKDTRRYRVDAIGNQLETLDGVEHAIRLTYDADGLFPVSLTEEDREARAVRFDLIAQQLAEMEDLNGRFTRTEYDSLGHITAVYHRGAQPGKPTETYERRRDVIPNLTITHVRINPDDPIPGYIKHEYFDGSGQVCQTRILAEDGRWSVSKQKIYGLSKHLLQEWEAYFAATADFAAEPPPEVRAQRYSYDFAGRLLAQTLFNGGITLYRYSGAEAHFFGPDTAGMTDGNEDAVPRRISRTDAWNRLVATVEFDSGRPLEERREYDALGHLKRLIDSLGHTALENDYDLRGNHLRVRSAEAGETTYIFDGANKVALHTDADRRSIYRKRDKQGRVLELLTDGPNGSVIESHRYETQVDGGFRRQRELVEGAFGTAEYLYNADGNPERIRRKFTGNSETYELGFTYNNQGDVTSVRYPDGTLVTYEYHPNGMLKSIPGVIDSIDYGPSGTRKRIVYANGLETRLRLTPGDELLSELLTQTADGGQRYQHLVYTLDIFGQVTRIDDLSKTPGKLRNNQTFIYDDRHRLIRATGREAAGEYDFAYRYDDLGNLLFTGESAAEELVYGHQLGDPSHPNRLVKRESDPEPAYLYDASGNLLHDPDVGDMSYDILQRLVQVERKDGSVVEYRYDHNGRRTESRLTQDGATVVRYDVEGLYLVEPENTFKVIYDESRKLALAPQTGSRLLHHFDRLGNVNVVSNLDTGAFVTNNEYTPYGRLSASLTIMPHYSFQGGRFSDGLDVVLLGARFYRPALGRFLTPDRYLLARQDKIVGWLAVTNLYLYALGNPVNYTDPTGQFFWAVVAIAAVVGAFLGGIGAAANEVSSGEELFLWIIGGAIGAALSVLTVGGFTYLAFAWSGSAAIFTAAGSAAYSAAIGTLIAYTIGSFLSSLISPHLDKTDSEVAWFFSFLIKWGQSPITTNIGGIVATFFAAAGNNVDFRRGMLFIDRGQNGGTLALGGIAWTGSNHFRPNGNVNDEHALHEALHSRQVGTLGELGFYTTYTTVAQIWGRVEGDSAACWNEIQGIGDGRGNPFEKTAYTYNTAPEAWGDLNCW